MNLTSISLTAVLVKDICLRISATSRSHKSVLSSATAGACCCILTLAKDCYAADEYTLALRSVKQQQCQSGETVEQILDRKHRNLYADRGWRVLKQKEGKYLVERIFMSSKIAEIHYRWLVSTQEQPQPASIRAQSLCSSVATFTSPANADQ